MIGLRRGQFGPKATPSQRDTIQRALWHLGSDCDRAFDLPLPSMCDSAAAARHGYTAPLRRGCREGRAST